MTRFGLLPKVLLVAGAMWALASPLSASQAARSSTNASSSAVLPNFAAQGSNLIRLLAGAFDPLSDPLPIGAGIPLVDPTTLAPIAPQYWLVQVRDAQYAQVTDAVTAAGATVVGSIPDAAYFVRATPVQKEQIAASPSVRWAGYYQPSWRVPVAAGGKQGLLELSPDSNRVYRVHVFRKDPNPQSVGTALAGLAGVTVVSDAVFAVDVKLSNATVQVPAIAAIPAVEWVGVKPRGVPLNSNSRWVNDTGVRDLFAATAPGRLTGAGQTAAVADTGLNYKYDLNGRAHVAFRDCNASGVCKEAIYTQTTPGTTVAQMTGVANNNTDHRKMVAYFDLGNTGPNMFDESSHGSHTGGSIDGDQPPYDVYTGDDGLAPAANHVHQNIANQGGGLVLPADDYQLWRQAYRPRSPSTVATSSGNTGNPNDYRSAPAGAYVALEDARTHNNSYGLIAPVIDEGSAVSLDRFVWDHEDMVIAVSAGNAGPDPGSIGSPSVAKNELSSGAMANGRQPMVSIDSMGSFSSHGPTGDGRLGVDLATPGQIVVSVKGGSTDGYHTAQGTSMSSPVLTGLATLVRQYFFDGYGPATGDGGADGAPGGDGFAVGTASAARSHNPSAALVKAALINGAERMRGWYTGDDGTNRVMDGQWPSGGQGFGRVTLDNSLYFANDPTNNWYIDVYRGDATAPASCPGGTTTASCTSFPMGAAAQRTFTLHVEAGQPLDVTLAWTDAPDLLPAGTPALVNNLDLIVAGAGGTFLGNNMNSRATPSVAVAETMNALVPRDTRNLTERVRIAAPVTGDYTITVDAPAILMARQGFALAASGKISQVTQPVFTPGPARQVDQVGNPVISNVKVHPISANTAKVTFDTNEPTTATATVTLTGGPKTFNDSYNIGTAADWPGLTIGPVETSADYANKLVVGTEHEILLTGFDPGQTYAITLKAKDLANNEVTAAPNPSLTAPAGVFQANATDTAQLYEDPQSATASLWQTGTQLYASDSGAGDGALGAFAFRAPAALDPTQITAATVELTSAHNWVVPYTSDPIYDVDLLSPSVEASWGTQIYSQIKSAAADARVHPETTHKRGAYYKYAFTFRCMDLQKLKDTLTTLTGGMRMAAFRWESSVDPVPGLFAMDFGFNRRSRGPDLRPKLVLYTGTNANPTGAECDPATPAPTISNVGIHDGVTANTVTVSWETDVDSDSMVLFREKTPPGPWIQVGTPARTKVHQVQVHGLSRTKEYEFAVRSKACNGAETTDTNGGAGYDFFYPEVAALTRYFSGTPQDQANKLANAPTATWQATPGASEPPINQTATSHAMGQAGHDAFHQSLGVYWDGQIPATLGAGSGLSVSVFARTAFGQVFVNSAKLTIFVGTSKIHQQDVGLNVAATGVLNEIPVTLQGTIPANTPVSIQLTTQFVNNDFEIQYFAPSAASNFYALLGPPPDVPSTGPVPPPSAGSTNLQVPATRTGAANAADIAAGTGWCSVAGPTVATIVSFTGKATGRRVVNLTWRTASEVDVLGFNVWRSSSSGKAVKVNRTLVAAKAAGRSGGAVYRLLDRRARRGAYTYRLQVVDRNGTRSWRARTVVRVT